MEEFEQNTFKREKMKIVYSNGNIYAVTVVYFDQLSGAAGTRKLVKQLCSAVFILFCSFWTFFSDFTAKNNKKHLKMNKKLIFVFSSKLVDMQKLVDSLRGYLECAFFGLFCSFILLFYSNLYKILSISWYENELF